MLQSKVLTRSKNTPAVEPTVAYNASHKITLAGLGCLYCGRVLRAQVVELLDEGGARIVCDGCHRDLLTIESK